ITSIPASRLAATFRSSSANRYGGIRRRRLLERMELLEKAFGERAHEHGNRPAGDRDVELVPNLDLELSAVERHSHRGATAGEHVRDRGAGRACPARRR